MIDPVVCRQRFRYDPDTGAVTRANGKSAVAIKVIRKSSRIAVVSLSGRYWPASHVVYAILHGVSPEGVRTRYLDGDSTNLRAANLNFCCSSDDAPGELRTCPAILKALNDLGGRASTAAVRSAGHLKKELAVYFRILEKGGKIHAVGVDEGNATTRGHESIVWALGPGTGQRPADVMRVARRMSAVRRAVKDVKPGFDAEAADAAAARQAAAMAITNARAGITANSVFTFASGSVAQQVSQC